MVVKLGHQAQHSTDLWAEARLCQEPSLELSIPPRQSFKMPSIPHEHMSEQRTMTEINCSRKYLILRQKRHTGENIVENEYVRGYFKGADLLSLPPYVVMRSSIRRLCAEDLNLFE